MIFVPNSKVILLSTNHFLFLTSTKKHLRNFVGVWELAFVAFGGLFF
jgi:hypothetical protein